MAVGENTQVRFSTQATVSATTQTPDTVGPSGGSAPAPPHKSTLLIVDDEEGPRQSLKVIFKDTYNILMASDGPSAIALAQKNRIDVAVIDIRMAGMSGIEVLERLKYVDPDIEVVMMTAFETTDTMRQALRLRACDYINKPFDISTMRAAVAKAIQRHTLESEVHTNVEKLQALVRDLEEHKIEKQMSQTRGEIYASIIHDINGPLTVISGFIQLLNQKIGNAARIEGPDLDFVRDRLKTITRQVTNCIEISRRYLGFLRRQGEDNPRVAVNQLLADLAHLLHVHPSLHQNQFRVQPLARDIGLRMHGTDAIQVLLNLAVNAFQCDPRPHVVEIETELLESPCNLAAFRDGPNDRFLNMESFENASPLLLVRVRDNGPGIPQETLPRIFQPYFTTKDPHHGTGLGLNIVQRLVRQAKGAVHVHSVPSEGTTFSVYLPAAWLPAP
jgi:two-component system, sensor histidine kinase and response regulator